MAESKYSRYIITDVKMDVDLPSYRGESRQKPDDSRKMPTRLMWLDSRNQFLQHHSRRFLF